MSKIKNKHKTLISLFFSIITIIVVFHLVTLKHYYYIGIFNKYVRIPNDFVMKTTIPISNEIIAKNSEFGSILIGNLVNISEETELYFKNNFQRRETSCGINLNVALNEEGVSYFFYDNSTYIWFNVNNFRIIREAMDKICKLKKEEK